MMTGNDAGGFKASAPVAVPIVAPVSTPADAETDEESEGGQADEPDDGQARLKV
jgi:hypothetical protein